MNDKERCQVLEDIDWMFAHMGAGDESFDGWDHAYPMVRNFFKRDVIAYLKGTPTQSGLEHPWLARSMCLTDSKGLFCMETRSVSTISYSLSLSKYMNRAIALGLGSERVAFSEMVDEVMLCNVGRFLPSGKRTSLETFAFG
jgi:hypothetical protein